MNTSFSINFLKSLMATSFGGIIVIAFHFLSIMVMTRYVTKDLLGLYFLILAVVQYLNIISGLGLNLTLVKFVSSEDGQTHKDIIASTIFVRFVSLIIIGIVFSLISRVTLPIFDSRLIEFTVLLIVMFMLTNIEELFLYMMQGSQQFIEYASVQTLSAIIRFALLFLFRNVLNFQYLIYIEILTLFIAILIQLLMTRSLLQNLSYRNINIETLRGLTRFGAPLYLNNILTVIYDRSSTLIIGILLTPVSVAAFEIALKIPDGLMRVFNSFIVVYFPGISKLFSQGKKEDAHKFMNNILVLLSNGILFCVLISFLYGENIILLLFSDKYLEVSLAFALLMLNFFLRAISNILGYSLVSAGHSSAPVKVNIISVLVNIVSCIVLIPKFGYIGAVYGLLIMNITSQVLYVFKLRQVWIMPNISGYIKPILLFTGIISIYLLLGVENFFLKLIFLGVYLLLSWLFTEEIRNFMDGAFLFLVKRKPKIESA